VSGHEGSPVESNGFPDRQDPAAETGIQHSSGAPRSAGSARPRSYPGGWTSGTDPPCYRPPCRSAPARRSAMRREPRERGQSGDRGGRTAQRRRGRICIRRMGCGRNEGGRTRIGVGKVMGESRRPPGAVGSCDPGWVDTCGGFSALQYRSTDPGSGRIAREASMEILRAIGESAGCPRIRSRVYQSSSIERMARNASWGTSTVPTCFIRFLPSFCCSQSLRFRVMSPP